MNCTCNQFIAVDVDHEAHVRRLIEFAVEKFGRLDLAVNNAGISNETKTIGDSDPAKFQAMLQTNVMGVYLCMKYEIQQMLKNGGGSIVNLASIAGLNGREIALRLTITTSAQDGSAASARTTAAPTCPVPPMIKTRNAIE